MSRGALLSPGAAVITHAFNPAVTGGPAPKGMPSRLQDAHRKEEEMPKLKTKSSAKKRFRLTATGKVRANPSCLRHGLVKRSKKMKRQARGTMILSAPDSRIVKSYMPNA